MALVQTEWRDQWIAEQYPHSLWLVDSSGELIVCLGQNEDGQDCY